MSALISQGSEDTASERTENRRFGLPHHRLTPPLQGIPANIRKPYTARNYSRGATSSALTV